MNKNSSVLKDIKSLGQLRDELKLQSHLFKVEAKKEWNQLERDWKVLKREVKPTAQAAKKSTGEIKKSTRELFRGIKSGYVRLKQALTD